MLAGEDQGNVSQRGQLEQERAGIAAGGKKPPRGEGLAAESFRFDDPYWDDAFDSYHDPTLRTCCRF